MKTHRHQHKSEGAMLVMVMAVLLGLSLIGVSLIRQGRVNGVEVSREVSKAKAFWTADAGIEEARAIAYRNYREAAALVFPATEPRIWNGSTAFGTYTVTVTEDAAAPGFFTAVSDALSDGGSQRILALNIAQEPALIAGVFGDSSLTLQPHIAIYSYHSSSNSSPTPGDSTGEVLIGSNESITLKPAVSVDGGLLVGQDEDGELAECSGCEGLDVDIAGRIAPDPLGIRGGAYEGLLNDAILNNNNAAVPEIVGNVWTVSNTTTSTIAAGTYYVTSVEIKGDVVVDTSGGNVEVFLAGPMKAWPGSTIGTSGEAARFRIYSNSDAGIDLQPDGDFAGFIYAPYSDEVKIRPGSDFYGSVWGESVKVLPNGDVYIDMDIMAYDAFTVFRMEFEQWRQLQ